MSDTEFFDLTIKSRYFEEVLHWSIVRQTEKACLVLTPCGELWLPLSLFKNRIYSVSQIDNLSSILNYLSANAVDSSVIVKKIDIKPTEKSQKCQVVIANKTRSDPDRTSPSKTRNITVTVPASQFFEENGEFYVPTWIMKRKLQKYEYLTQASSPTVMAVKAEVTSIVNRLKLKDEQESVSVRSSKLVFGLTDVHSGGYYK